MILNAQMSDHFCFLFTLSEDLSHWLSIQCIKLKLKSPMSSESHKDYHRAEKSDSSKVKAQLTLKSCYAFPLSSPQARRDLIFGSLLLYTLLIGWIFNLGHRLDVVHRAFHGQAPIFRGFTPLGRTFKRGLQAFLAIGIYLTPALTCFGLSYLLYPHEFCYLVTLLAAFLFLMAIYSLPGGMTYNAAFHEIAYLYRPDKALKRASQAGRPYLKAWLIGLSAILLSLLTLSLGLVIFDQPQSTADWIACVFAMELFFIVSVWAWNVVGFAFSLSIVYRDHEID